MAEGSCDFVRWLHETGLLSCMSIAAETVLYELTLVLASGSILSDLFDGVPPNVFVRVSNCGGSNGGGG